MLTWFRHILSADFSDVNLPFVRISKLSARSSSKCAKKAEFTVLVSFMFFPLAFTYFAFVVWFFRPFSCDLYFSLWHPLFVFEFLSVYLILISFICVQISVHLSSPSSACFFSFLVLCFISSPLLRFVFSKTFYVSSVSFVLTHKNTDPFLLKGCEWNVDMPIGSENGYLPQWDSLFHFPSTDGFLAFGTDPCTDRGQSTCCCDFQRFVHCTNVSVSSVTQRCLLFWPLWTLQGSMDIIWRCETQFFEFKHSGVSEEEFLQENSFLYIFFLES